MTTANPRRRCAPLLALAACAAPAALGAVAPAPPIRQVGPNVLDSSSFQRIDPTYQDADPLRMSLRELSVDLRQSDDFTNVYRIPGARADGMDDRYARRSGGITAVFPRSTYVSTDGGVMAAIPAGTVFYLDGVPAPQPWEAAGPGDGARAGAMRRTTARRADTYVSTSTAAAYPGAEIVAENAAPADEALFVGVRALLRHAASR